MRDADFSHSCIQRCQHTDIHFACSCLSASSAGGPHEFWQSTLHDGACHFLRAKQAKDTLKVMAVIAGNRNVGLYYAALPYDPVMGLFTAMYQVPLYLTPLFLGLLNRTQKIPKK